MQNSSNLDEPLPLNSFDFHRDFEVVQLSNKRKQLRNIPYKIFNKPTDVTYETLT